MFRIYKYTNIITGKSYIGQTIRCVNQRARRNGKGYKDQPIFYSDIQQYGWDNFEQSILRLCESKEDADYWERFFIEKYNTIFPNGYNYQIGGQGKGSASGKSNPMYGRHQSEETRKKISDKAKERFSNPQNHPCYGKYGENHPCYGKHWKLSEETKKRISEAAKERWAKKNN